jgi:hypothetical protein
LTVALFAKLDGTVQEIDRLGGRVLRSSLVDAPAPAYVPAEEAGGSSGAYAENNPVPASPYVQLSAGTPTPASARIPSQNTDFKTAYSPCGDGGNLGDRFSEAKETNNNQGNSVTLDIGHDDKYSTLHWNENTEKYFWGAEGEQNCYIGKHLGKGVGADLTKSIQNVGIGVESGHLIKTAKNNVWAGFQAFAYATTPELSVVIGDRAGYFTDDGRGNVFVGARSGYQTSDVTRSSETREAPIWTRVYLSSNDIAGHSMGLTDLDGELVHIERHADAAACDLMTSPDGATWTIRDTKAICAAGIPYAWWLTSSTRFGGKVWFNAYYPNAPEQGFFATWDGITLGHGMLLSDVSPDPANVYCDRIISHNGMLFVIMDITTSINPERRAVYWSVDGTTWTKVTYYVDLFTTYYDYGNVYQPDLNNNYTSKSNRFVELGGDLYWVCSRYESSYWHTKILKLSSIVSFTVVGDIIPDSDYMHPMAAEVVGDTCYLFIQELGSNGSYDPDHCKLQLYTSPDMINWTKRADYGGIGVISDSIWFEHELVIARTSVVVATLGQTFIDRIDPVTYVRTNEVQITTNGTTVAGSDLHAFNGELFLGKRMEVYKRVRTTWLTTEMAYDLTASYNTLVGMAAGYGNVDGQGNLALGAFSDFSGGSLINAAAIGYHAICSASHTIILGGTGDYAVKVGIGRTQAAYTLDVFGDGRFTQKLTISVATGTAPLIVSSTTVCANLNVDMVDGYHQDQALLTTSGPSFDHLHLTIASGTAPLVVTSTTVVTNLNADLLDGNHASAFAVAAHTHVQADIAGLHIDDNVTFASLYLGVDDTARGVAHLYGPGTGYTYGGSIYLYLGADYDTAIAEFGFVTLQDDLLIGPDTDRDALKLDSNLDFYVTAGSLVLPASEYLNFGGVLGSGGYGVRDNAGRMEFCHSAGAWTEFGAGGSLALDDLTDVDAASPSDHDIIQYHTGVGWVHGALPAGSNHDILSATHGDATAGSVVAGGLIYGDNTPKWTQLAHGNDGDVLTLAAGLPSWAAPGGSSHVLLSATHTDTLADTVVRGDILYGNVTPKWARLAKGTLGYVLTMGANEPGWAAPAAGGGGDFLVCQVFS